MKTATLVWIVAIIIVILGGWYFFARSGAGATAEMQPAGALGVQGSQDQTNTGQAAVPPVVTVAHDATLGDYLVAENGMTVYLYTKDTTNVSNCSGTCAVNWPPYLRTGAEPLVAGENATGTLATIARADGGEQVTYNGIPLYFWKNDAKPGDTTGQNVGGVWFVVQP